MSTYVKGNYDAHGRELVALLTARGLGAIPKRDLDALLLFLLEKHLGWASRTNQQLSLLLRLPVPKVKALRYEAALRYTEDLDAEFRTRLRRLLRQAAFSEKENAVEFVVEDYASRFVLEEYLKRQGKTAAWSFNGEAISAPVEALAAIMADQFDDQEKMDALARLGIADPSTFSATVEAAFLEIVDAAKKSRVGKLSRVLAKAAGIGKQARIVAQLLFD